MITALLLLTDGPLATITKRCCRGENRDITVYVLYWMTSLWPRLPPSCLVSPVFTAASPQDLFLPLLFVGKMKLKKRKSTTPSGDCGCGAQAKIRSRREIGSNR